VLEGPAAVRSLSKMYVGVRRDDPGLLDGAMTLLRAQFEHAVATGEIGSVRLEVDPDSAGRRFTVDVRGHQLPSPPAGVDGIFAGISSLWPLEYLSVVAALSSRVWVREWSEGRCTVSEYVDGMALGTDSTLTGTPPRDGYEVTIEMDDSWRPLGVP
jgi:hypothetical protein